MSHDEYLKLFKYIERRLSLIDSGLENFVTKSEFSTFVNAFDESIKRNEIIYHEILALGHQVERHDSWIHKIAKKTDVKLSS